VLFRTDYTIFMLPIFDRVKVMVRVRSNVQIKGNSPDTLRHPRSDAYSEQQVLLNKQQIWLGRAYLDCYQIRYSNSVIFKNSLSAS